MGFVSRWGRRMGLLAVLIAVVGSATPAPESRAAAAGPAQCWVSWRPSEGSISFAAVNAFQTQMTIKLKWRKEDLSFTSCRSRTAFELETFFGTSHGRHKLTNLYWVTDSTFPAWYIDSSQEFNEATFGVGDAESLTPGRWYSIEFRFIGHLGPNEFVDVSAARGYRWSPCIGGYANCVSGWRNDDKFGPADKLQIIDNKPAVPGRTISWSYPARSTLYNKIIRHPGAGDAHVLDARGVRHWIPTGGVYNCLTGQGWQVVNSFSGLNQRWVINSFSEGSHASCASGGTAPPPVVPLPGDGSSPGGGSPGGATVTLSQGPPGPVGFRYAIALSGFAPGSDVSISCRDSVDPGGFYSFTLHVDGTGSASTASYCYSADGPDHWIVAGGVESNHVSWSGGSPPPPQPSPTYTETTGGVAHTWTNYTNAGGYEGPTIPAFASVQISCKLSGFRVADGNTWWYRIGSAPWSDNYYVSADAFYNNGATSGSLHGTPFVDPNVRDC